MYVHKLTQLFGSAAGSALRKTEATNLAHIPPLFDSAACSMRSSGQDLSSEYSHKNPIAEFNLSIVSSAKMP